jgi:hypothetical protein
VSDGNYEDDQPVVFEHANNAVVLDTKTPEMQIVTKGVT